jgi:cobaltochelatase CobS
MAGQQRHRLTNAQRKDLANEILDYLKNRTIPVKASTVFANLRYDGPDYNVRRTLERLEVTGAVQREGESRFHWRIRTSEWDRNNPFKLVNPDDDDDDFTPEPDEDDEEDTPVKKPVITITHDDGRHLVERDKEFRHNMTQRVDALEKWKEAASADIERLHKEAQERVPFRIEIKRYDGTVKELKDKIVPKEFKRAVELANCRRNILLVGPSGCGKSYMAQMIADSLNMKFGSISCTAGMSESHLLGRAVPDLTHGKNRYQSTDFVDRYEGGGIFLLDEVDAADANMMLSINTGLANQYLNLPNRNEKPRAERHADFVCIATANTVGRGATRMYLRNQLDESTIDRFRIGIVEMEYSREVETILCPNLTLRNRLWSIREKIARSGVRRIMSTRFLEDAQVMLDNGWMVADIVDTYFSGWTDEEKAKVK